MVDTGLGPGPHAAQNGVEGKLLANLAAVGVQPSDVDGVINTHIHPDHVGWNIVDGKPTFSRARYTVSRVDWEHWTNQDDAPSYVPNQVVPLEDLGVLDLVEDDQEIFIGVRTLGTPGHTPGHQSILIESGGEAAVITGDVLHTPAQLQEPDWSFRADIDKGRAIASRQMLIEKAISDKLTVAAGHLRYDGNLGHIVEIEGRRYWQVLAD